MSDVAGRGGFRAFLVLWGTQTLSLFGTMVTQFAANVWLARDLYPTAAQRPQLALALSAVGLASAAPMIFFMPIAGAFADHHDRQRILVTSNAVLAVLTAALVALSALHQLTLPVAVLLLVLYSVAGSFHSAAFDSSYGRFVTAEQLPRAGGMMQTSFGLAQLLAPPLAAALVGIPALLAPRFTLPDWLASGVPFAFAADGLTFVVAGVCAAALRFPAMPESPERATTSLWGAVREGFRWVLTRRPFLTLIGLGAIANFTFAPLMVLLPLLTRDRVGADAAAHHLSFEATLAAANVSGGLGAVLGGVLVSAFGLRQWKRTYVMAACLLVLGLGQVMVGLATSVWLLVAGMFVGESLVAPLNTASYTLWQSLTPPQMLARALATRRFIAQGAFPLGTAAAGWLAAAAEPWQVTLGFGAVLVLASAWCLASPGFRTLEERMREAAARAG